MPLPCRWLQDTDLETLTLAWTLALTGYAELTCVPLADIEPRPAPQPAKSSTLPARTCPTRLLGDTAYGNIEVREQLEQRAISVLAPLHTTSSGDDETFHKDEFAIDLQADTVTCPQGNTAPIYKPTQPAGSHRPRMTAATRSLCGVS